MEHENCDITSKHNKMIVMTTKTIIPLAQTVITSNFFPLGLNQQFMSEHWKFLDGTIYVPQPQSYHVHQASPKIFQFSDLMIIQNLKNQGQGFFHLYTSSVDQIVRTYTLL